MPTYWDEFIDENRDWIPYSSLADILEKFYKFLEIQGKIK